ncbi:hypothetical protein YC2023_099267 [Brassica napus]
MSEGEMKPTPEKHESRLETRNNLPNLQSILGGEHYPNLEWQTWRKRERESQRRKKDERGVTMVSQRRGKQLQRRLNSDSTQRDAVPNIS